MKTVYLIAVMTFTANGIAQDAETEGRGVVLTYECEGIANQSLVESIERRLRPVGSGVSVRLRKGTHVDVMIPTLDKDVIVLVKRSLASRAKLEFLVVANSKDHPRLLELAAETTDAMVVSGARVIGRWATVTQNTDREYRMRLEDGIVRDGKTKSIVEDPRDVDNAEVLLAIEPDGAVGGEDVKIVREGWDSVGNPCVDFEMTGLGTTRLHDLTMKYARDPETGFSRCLAIVFDEKVLCAPRLISAIGGRGRITGEFTRDEVRFLVNVLRAGRLPVALKQPPTESRLDP